MGGCQQSDSLVGVVAEGRAAGKFSLLPNDGVFELEVDDNRYLLFSCYYLSAPLRFSL